MYGRMFTFHAVDTFINIGPLRAGNLYSCRVAAFTIALGPFTARFTVRSVETGKYRSTNMSVWINPIRILILVSVCWSDHFETVFWLFMIPADYTLVPNFHVQVSCIVFNEWVLAFPVHHTYCERFYVTRWYLCWQTMNTGQLEWLYNHYNSQT